MSDYLTRPDAAFAVTGFLPPPLDHPMGGYAFEVSLALPFARECAGWTLTAEQQARFNRRCRSLVAERIFSRSALEFHQQPTLRFHRDSLLVEVIEVPGVNGCTLHLESADGLAVVAVADGAALVYTTHNVDSVQQAFALMSCWLMWHRAACATLYREPAVRT